MKPRTKKTLAAILVLIILLSITGGLVGNNLVKASFPQTSGEIQLTGLDGKVTVIRDNMGIPHIYAGSLHDLFMAQGFVTAQDRFWQMDFWRHIGSGNLSEMFGKGQLDTDAFLRTLGWKQLAEEEAKNLDTESSSILSAYADGVNKYLSERSGAQLSLEYSILGLLTPSYKPAPWTPVNSLSWAKAMAWDLRGNMGEEIDRSILLKTLTPEQVDQLYPPYPKDHPVIVPQIGDFSTGSMNIDNSRQTANSVNVPDLARADLQKAAKALSSLDAVLGKANSSIGSNSWVISGKLSQTGMPLLANDPHLSSQMPSIWYQVDLHCQPKSDACPFEVSGFSFAGVPGVVIGHNDRIAWAFTNTGPDVMDLFVEKINPDNPNQYEYMGKWVDMDVRTETMK
ncbi:MAG: penicillin acylase family protein, partial [Chloroflexota bacterium]